MMKLAKRFRKIFLGTLAANLGLLPGLPSWEKPNTLTSGEIVDGLQISISVDLDKSEPSKTPKFIVELRNAGENDLILNLGMMVANGEKQHPDAVVLTLTSIPGKSRQLHLRGPWFIASRVDPLIVPLPVGSTFSIPVDLNDYWPIAPTEPDYKLEPGNYRLEAQFTGRGVSQHEANLDVKGIALMPYWKGTVTSNQLSFQVPNQTTGQDQGHALSREERIAGYRHAQIVETKSSLEIAVNFPRPLDDVLTALAKKYGWRINYEDPHYKKTDVVEVTAPSWLRQHADGPYAYAVAGGAFSAKISLRAGCRRDPQQVIAAVVKAYNSSGNPGRFEVRVSQDEWFDVVPTAAADGPEKPILDTLVGFDATPPTATEFSLQVFCKELALRSRQPIDYHDFSPGRMPEQGQPRIEVHDPNRPAREVLRQMLRESLTTSWSLYYDPDLREFMLLLRSDSW
jgi:hypothetical protein